MSRPPARERKVRPARALDASNPTGWPQRFFTGLGLWCILIVVIGFGPSVYLSASGELFIPVIAHVHAAVMMAWLVVYTVQAHLAARGDLKRHRRAGWAATVLAAAVWISMAVATVTALQRFDPDEFAFLIQPLLIQLGTMAVFPMFVIWAVAARRRTGWHKRLMTFATFTLAQAAFDRMHWLPDEGLPMFWHSGLRSYVLLMLPLLVFDIITRRRIHPATLMGSSLIVAMHGIVSFYWNHEGWNQVARGFWMWVR